ncbi:receptor-like protein 12 [Gossypium australe]|uniref:Receptor-like protein 12 n=1 Tax=Gossypium australe TaxID=47621 RepID=A0A5B6WTE6_9ROSI|nr:receptor-like protein 12 [Gossypium australe]
MHHGHSCSHSKIKVLEVYGDSTLMIYKLKGEWKTRDTKLINYRRLSLMISPSIISYEMKTKWLMPWLLYLPWKEIASVAPKDTISAKFMETKLMCLIHLFMS